MSILPIESPSRNPAAALEAPGAVVAALYVLPDGPYALAGVDLWDKRRDARRYAGPSPVVAHPPCERWSYAARGGSRYATKQLGDDGGCFAAALASVRQWGGVLEHPANSKAWEHFGLGAPRVSGGWLPAPQGWTCSVEQGHYGHRARKRTWLYVASQRQPEPLCWGSSALPLPAALRLPPAYHSPSKLTPAERLDRRRMLALQTAATGKIWLCPEQINKRERQLTPEPFRDLLICLALEARP